MTFARRLLAWASEHGRTGLPWQRDRDPYRVWVAEIMLQQTQVTTVIPYFERFMAEFPTLRSLADADTDRVLAAWSGLGYYARARNLHATARRIRDEHAGEFPRAFEAVVALPGIGRSTAGAILATAFDERHPILDGNCRRVYARHAGIDGPPQSARTSAALWEVAERHTPPADARAYTQAIMDLGSTVCTRTDPACDRCPVAGDCVARRENRIDELPAKARPKPRPVRDAVFAVVRDPAGAVLFERRPDKGVWGGLWCLPWLDARDAAAAYAAEHGATEARDLPGLHHVFTHFELRIAPVEYRADGARPHTRERIWAASGDWHALALPTPVRRVLDALESAP